MFKSPVQRPEAARTAVAQSLNARLADLLDLHSHLKLAHWNVRGAHFATLHPLFESFADAVDAEADAVAERAVMMGALAQGTARQVAAASSLAEYPVETTIGLVHVRNLADRYDVALKGLHTTRALADEHGDEDTVDLLTETVAVFEKHAWYLRATLEG